MLRVELACLSWRQGPNKTTEKSSIVDLNPHWLWSAGSRSGSRRAKMIQKKKKLQTTFHVFFIMFCPPWSGSGYSRAKSMRIWTHCFFLSSYLAPAPAAKCWKFSFEAGGFSCSLNVHHKGLELIKCNFRYNKKIRYKFWLSKPWARIRIYQKCWIWIRNETSADP